MNEENQIVIPDAFVQIYTDPLRHRLTLRREELLQRYELCDDLANLLTDRAAEQKFKTGLEDEEVLAQIHAGLLAEDAGVTAPEADWILGRIGELLGW